ncbi:hypothetical protein [Photobacterium leiognathi]|uniref:hypothetical protein n=1 Tax=Photobacterium leiognathi TaxID=553611 RepID=UPI0029821A6E|nr:hypothetical protein [Photobacterium leiognathi]
METWIEADVLGDKTVWFKNDFTPAEGVKYCTFHYTYPFTDNSKILGAALEMQRKISSTPPLIYDDENVSYELSNFLFNLSEELLIALEEHPKGIERIAENLDLPSEDVKFLIQNPSTQSLAFLYKLCSELNVSIEEVIRRSTYKVD